MFETFLSNDSHTALISTPFLCAQKKVGNMKNVFEKIIEGILACSGFVTSLTIVLIVLFLFSEAVGLFHSRVIEPAVCNNFVTCVVLICSEIKTAGTYLHTLLLFKYRPKNIRI